MEFSQNCFADVISLFLSGVTGSDIESTAFDFKEVLPELSLKLVKIDIQKFCSKVYEMSADPNGNYGCTNCPGCKGCILCENCYNCVGLIGCKDMIRCRSMRDCFHCVKCYDGQGLSYCKNLVHCIDCHRCENSKYLFGCNICRDSSFLFSCFKCTNVHYKVEFTEKTDPATKRPCGFGRIFATKLRERVENHKDMGCVYHDAGYYLNGDYIRGVRPSFDKDTMLKFVSSYHLLNNLLTQVLGFKDVDEYFWYSRTSQRKFRESLEKKIVNYEIELHSKGLVEREYVFSEKYYHEQLEKHFKSPSKHCFQDVFIHDHIACAPDRIYFGPVFEKENMQRLIEATKYASEATFKYVLENLDDIEAQERFVRFIIPKKEAESVLKEPFSRDAAYLNTFNLYGDYVYTAIKASYRDIDITDSSMNVVYVDLSKKGEEMQTAHKTVSKTIVEIQEKALGKTYSIDKQAFPLAEGMKEVEHKPIISSWLALGSGPKPKPKPKAVKPKAVIPGWSSISLQEEKPVKPIFTFGKPEVIKHIEIFPNVKKFPKIDKIMVFKKDIDAVLCCVRKNPRPPLAIELPDAAPINEDAILMPLDYEIKAHNDRAEQARRDWVAKTGYKPKQAAGNVTGQKPRQNHQPQQGKKQGQGRKKTNGYLAANQQ